MENKAMELLDECWELIIKGLDHHDDLEAISLVCKRFLSISSRVKRVLTISDLNIPPLPNFSKLSQRFRYIKQINISPPFHYCFRDVDDLLFKIARSGFDLEELSLSDLSKIPVKGLKELGSTMKCLKTLTCTRCVLNEEGLFAIAQSLPRLQELDISHFFDEPGMIHKAAISDKWMEELASKLKHVIISPNSAMGFHALRFCTNLKSLTVTDLRSPATFTIDRTLSYSRALCSLEFQHSDISDALIASIVEAHLPLKKLKFHDCKNITPSGLSILLHKYRSLTEFKITYSMYLTDQDMDHLSKYLHQVTHIDLSGGSKLTNSTFFTLAKNCPLLAHITMDDTSLGEEGGLHVDWKKNSALQVLDSGGNNFLNGETFKKIGHVCPNLQMIDLSCIWNITEQCISEVLMACPGIRHFIVNKCRLETVLGKYSERSKLKIELLEARDARVNDIGMAMIAMRCPDLLKLKLRYCKEVTAEGVKEIMEKCPKLMEIDLKYCYKVGVGVLFWMLLERPSLRKVISPYKSFPTEETRRLFMHHGCRLF